MAKHRQRDTSSNKNSAIKRSPQAEVEGGSSLSALMTSRTDRLKIAVNSSGWQTEQLATFFECSSDFIVRCFKSSPSTKPIPSRWLDKGEQQFLTNAPVAPDHLGNYSYDTVIVKHRVAGEYQLVRPTFVATEEILIASKLHIDWDFELPGLVFKQNQLPGEKFDWQVGGEIAIFAGTQVWHFVSNDNHRGRQQQMSLLFTPENRTFHGFSLGTTRGLAAPLAQPVIVIPWSSSKQQQGPVALSSMEYTFYMGFFQRAFSYHGQKFSMHLTGSPLQTS